MPIYAYRCTDCGFEQDVMQKMAAHPLTTCAACHAETFAKQLSAPGLLRGGAAGSAAGAAATSDSAPAGCGGHCACH